MKTHSNYNLEIFETIDALNLTAAKFIVSVAKKAIALKGRFSIVLSGGQTPQKLFSLLAKPPFRDLLQWKHTFVFWADERFVPLDDEQNNSHMAKSILLDKIDIPFSNIHIIPVNFSPKEAVSKYEKELLIFFGKETQCFDLILLGLGENGHTASLFPGSKVINELTKGIREVYVEEEKMFRITMTASLINLAHNILFLVAGENKAEILKKVLTASYEPDLFPAQQIKPSNGNLFWFVDKAAASLITDF